MPGWQEKVVKVMLADTSDLRELARMVGHDPAIFWRDANFRQADLSDQDLSGLDIPAAILPSTANATSELARGGPDPAADPKAEADEHLMRGLKALDLILAEWPQSEAPIATAIAAFRRAVDVYRSISYATGEMEARRALSETLLLSAHITSDSKKDQVYKAEDDLRCLTSKLMKTPVNKELTAKCFDAHSQALLFKSRVQESTIALETLQRASTFCLTRSGYFEKSLLEIRKMGVLSESFARSDTNSDVDCQRLRENIKVLERIWSPVTGRVPKNVTAAAQIQHSAHRLTLARMTRKPLGSKAREDTRDHLITAMRSASHLDWIEAQRCLTELDATHSAASEMPAKDYGPDALEAARAVALQRAQTKLADGDAHLRGLISAPDPDFALIASALECYDDAEDLFGIVEDVARVDGEPGLDYAILRRGMAHLLRTTDDALTGEAQAEACTDARFALDLAAASLAGRNDVPLALAEALDAQAFGLRIEARVSTSGAAVEALAEAAALHRRASRMEGVSRAVSYRYRTHIFGAERELEERRSADPAKLEASRLRAQKALERNESRTSDRISAAEQAVHMAMLAEYAMSVAAELKLANPAYVREQQVQSKAATDQAIDEAMRLASALFMPLDWILLRRAHAQLQRLNAC